MMHVRLFQNAGLWMCSFGCLLACGCAASGLLTVNPVGEACFWPKDYKAPTQRVQFVVFGDRTGGHIPGLTAQAIAEINALRPEFVIAVGDQIEGYVRKTQVDSRERLVREVTKQWAEYDSLISNFTVPYFYVVGNHDMWDAAAAEIYQQLHGPPYYSFTVKGVHVIALNSEQHHIDHEGPLGKTQLGWLKRDLAQHKNVALTVVVLHKPLWRGRLLRQWKQIEPLLAGRNYMVIAGHQHNYGYEVRNGMPYVVVGPTGASPRRPNDALGQIRHVTVVTVEDGKPHVAVVKLGSVLPGETITQTGKRRAAEIWYNSRLLYSPADAAERGPITITWAIKNPQNISTQVRATWQKDSPWQVEPAEFSALLKPQQSSVVQFQARLRMAGTSSLPAANVELAWPDGAAPPVKMNWIAQPLRQIIAERTDRLTVDGKAESFWRQAVPAVLDRACQVAWGMQYLDGPGDLAVQVRAACDGLSLYLLVSVQDDDVLIGQDEVVICISPPPFERILVGSSRVVYKLSIKPSSEPNVAMLRWISRGRIDRTAAATQRTETGWIAEICLPLRSLVEDTDRDIALPFNVAVLDADAKQATKTTLVWSGDKNYMQTTRDWGVLYLKRPDE